jgi:hypothetical protein
MGRNRRRGRGEKTKRGIWITRKAGRRKIRNKRNRLRRRT